MSTATAVNGKPRKQLCDQLDRLDDQLLQIDRVLDALADGLNGAVREAAKEGTRVAVKEAVVALLTDTDLRDALHQASTPPAEAKPSFWERIKANVQSAARHVKDAVVSGATAVANRAADACSAVGRLFTRARQSSQVRTAAKIVVGVGAMIAVARYAATRGVGTMFATAQTFVMDLVIRTKDWVRLTVLCPQTT
jgi:hypothetical protein